MCTIYWKSLKLQTGYEDLKDVTAWTHKGVSVQWENVSVVWTIPLCRLELTWSLDFCCDFAFHASYPHKGFLNICNSQEKGRKQFVWSWPLDLHPTKMIEETKTNNSINEKWSALFFFFPTTIAAGELCSCALDWPSAASQGLMSCLGGLRDRLHTGAWAHWPAVPSGRHDASWRGTSDDGSGSRLNFFFIWNFIDS